MVASQEGNLEVARALLKGGALPNASTIRGSTALIQACHFGKLSVVEELLKNGAMVDQANLKNTTALMRASQEGHKVSLVCAILPRYTEFCFALNCIPCLPSLYIALYPGCGAAPAIT